MVCMPDVIFLTCLTLSRLYHGILQKFHHDKVVQLHQILFVSIILRLQENRHLQHAKSIHGVNQMRYPMLC